MTPERWKRIEELYHEARARAPADRSAFLAVACVDDEAMRRNVESLLDESDSDDGFLGDPPLDMSPHTITSLLATRVGTSIGGYELQALLGAGGMGEVYRAHDTKLGRDVAIKILPSAFTNNPDRLARLEREARMLAALNHPNICAIYGFEEAGGIRFLILELVEGETLADTLAHASSLYAKDSGLPFARALGIARHIAEALEVAHDKGIVHRDLKPANIKITPDGAVKVLDFGLAKAVHGDGSSPDLSSAATEDGGRRQGAVVGTAAYMSPEQARGLPVDKRTDIWAFGCVLYEMLTGRVTFPGGTASDSIAKILEREPDWSVLPASTPASIRRLLLRCLTKDPKQRLRDIGDVRIEIDSVEEVQLATSVGTALPASATPVTRWLPWVALVALAAGVVIREARRPVTSQIDPRAPSVHDHLLGVDRTWSWEPLTDWNGSEWAADISPDAKSVAFLADPEGQIDLFVKQVDTKEEPENRTRDRASLQVPEILRPMGFYADGVKLWLSGVFGEAKWLLTRDGTRQEFLAEAQQAPAFSSRGDRLVFFTQRANDSLFVSEPGDPLPETAKELVLNEPSAGNMNFHRHNPVFSHDDKLIYYVRGTVRVFNQNDQMDIWEYRFADRTARQLTHLNVAITYLAVYDARTVLFVARDIDRSGPWLWMLDVLTEKVRRFPERISSVAISRNRERGVVTMVDPVPTLWTVRIPEGDRQADEAEAKPHGVGTSRARAPRYGPDGLLYFLSGQGQHDGLWSFKEGRLEEKKSAEDWKLFEPPAPSPDGRRVAVVRKNQDGKYRLTIESAIDALDVYGTVDWSPIRGEIVAGGVANGVRGLYRIPVDGPDGGKAFLLREGDFSNPIYSPEGDFIVCSGPFSGSSDLRALRSDDGQDYKLTSVVGRTGPLKVSPGSYRFRDQTHLVYLERPESADFFEFDLVTGTTRQITRLQNKGTLQGFDITPDRKHIIFDRTLQNANIKLIKFN